MRRFLCAWSFKHADNTAVVDWGWKRTGEWTWANKEGEEVRYISRLEQLCGMRDCVLYLGHAWWENRDLGGYALLHEHARLRNIVLMDKGE